MSSLFQDHPDELLPWYANGTLVGEDLRQVEEHLESCIACRRTLRELEALHLEIKDTTRTEVSIHFPGEAGLENLLETVAERKKPKPSLIRMPWLPPALAAFLLIAVGLLQFHSNTSPVQERGDDAFAALKSTLEPSVLPRTAFKLQWETAEAWRQARFSVRLTTVNLQLVAEAHDLTEPHYRVPQENLADLPSATQLLWQVEAIHPDGQRTYSPTFLVTLE